MSISFACANCQKSFTVADSASGKKGRCKDCGHLNTIPSLNPTQSSTDSGSPNPSATYEVTSAINGAVFGPADKKTLGQWVAEKRITADCQIKRVGADKWVPAKKLFKQLGQSAVAETLPGATTSPIHSEAADSIPDNFAKFRAGGAGETSAALSAGTTANPYAAVSTVKQKLNVSGEVVPTTGDIGFIISHAFAVFKSNIGLMIGGFVVYFVLCILNAVVIQAFPLVLGDAGAVVGGILNLFISSYLGAGIINLCLKVGRDEPATLGDLFSVADRVLPILGFGLFAGISLILPLAFVGFIAAFLSRTLGPDAALISGVVSAVLIFAAILIACLLIWPCYFLIVDRKTTLIESFGVGIKIGRKNVLHFIALYFIASIIFVAGFLMLGVGVLFSGPLASLIICCSYLNMSGQIKE